MSAPAAAETPTQDPTPTAADAAGGWESSDTPEQAASEMRHNRSVEVGDWRGDSSSRELPSEDAMRRSLSEEPPADSREWESNGPDHPTVEDALKAENERRAADAEPATPADQKADGEQKPEKKSKPLARRISEEQGRLKQTREERGAEERRRDALKAEVEQLEKRRTELAAGKVEGKTPPPTDRPRWDDYDKAGKTFDEYENDVDRWHEASADRRYEDQRRRELDQAERALAARRHDEFAQEVDGRIEVARKAHEDFDEAIESLGQIKTSGKDVNPSALFLHDTIAMHPQGGEIMYFLGKRYDDVTKALLAAPLTDAMFDALRDTSNPTGMLEHFAANPSEVERIARLSPPSALVALGRLMSQVEGAPAGSPAPPSHVTKAVPPPAARVDGSRQVAAARTAAEPDEPSGGWDTR